MKYPTLLLDFDGVISPGRYFSEIYSSAKGIDIETILPFFNNDLPAATIGKADLKDLLKPVLPQWKWNGTVEDLMEYWFNSDTELDPQVVAFIKELQTLGHKVYLVTDQEQYKGDFIWERRGLREWMDGRFVSYEIGAEKSNPRFFEHVISVLQVDPREMLLIDDSASKIQGALQAGINGYKYEDLEGLKQFLSE